MLLPSLENRLLPSAIFLACMMIFMGCGGGSSSGNSSQPTTGNINNGQTVSAPPTGQAGDGTLQDIVSFIRIEANLPALAAVLIHDGEVIEVAADGRRSINSDISVTLDDKWHLGSITKSMTATLAARLIEGGQMDWQMTVLDVYPELADSMNAHYQTATLATLFTHTAGFIENLPTTSNYALSEDEITIQRQKMLEEALLLTPDNTTGSFKYSNLSYMVAGAMMEKVTGFSWETLMQMYVFDPLDMANSGFGSPDEHNDLQQPVGHSNSNGEWRAVTGDAQTTDNPAILGPAGRVHASLADMANYLSLHLKGLNGQDTQDFLSAVSFEKLHTPPAGTHYALGWGINNGALIHSGSNTIWLAKTIIQPSNNTAIFVVTNSADLANSHSASVAATDKLLNEISQRAQAVYGN